MKRITLALPAPYIGLRPFDEGESLLFFGRERHVCELLARLERTQRFIAVLGASGTGKSSLVRAGLVPALHRGALASAGYDWNVCTFKPGDSPLDNLARALAADPRWVEGDAEAGASSLSALLGASPLALAQLYEQKAGAFGGQALLLVVDQFEEVFRYEQKSSDEAEAFVRLLLRSSSEHAPIYVVVTMRSEYLGQSVRFLGLPEAINDGLYLTPRLGPEQLKSVIVSPLALVAGEIDPLLANKLVNTLEGEDELPVLEHALLRMWNRARADGRRRIESGDFKVECAPSAGRVPETGTSRAPGGQPRLSCAIDNHASQIYEKLSAQSQRTARQLFIALVDRRDGVDLRRPQTLGQLVDQVGPDERERLREVIEAFRAEQVGFLLPSPAEQPTIDDGTLVDVSHESLIRRWQRLRQWLADEQVDAAELEEWRHRASMRQGGGGRLDECDCGRALRWCERVNSRVASPERWAARYGGPGTWSRVFEYVDESQARLSEAKEERDRLERSAREATLRKRRAVALSLVALVAVVMAFYLVAQERSSKNRAIADGLAVKADNVMKDRPDSAVLLGLAALRLSPVPSAAAFIRAARGTWPLCAVLRGHEGGVTNAEFSGDGRIVLTASKDGTARLWDAATGEPLRGPLKHGGVVTSARFSPDGRIVVTASGTTARLWDVATGEPLRGPLEHKDVVTSARFSPDGRIVVTAGGESARLWDVATGEALRGPLEHKDVVTSARFSPDGRIVVTASGKTARLWDVATGHELEELRAHEGVVRSARFSPDGSIVLTASEDKTARLWDAATGRQSQVLRGHGNVVWDAWFSADGGTVLTASDDKTARLWNVTTGKELQVLRGHAGAVTAVQLSTDRTTVLTASWDRSARLWDAASGKELQVLRGHAGAVTAVQFSTDGRTVLTASADGTARLWDAVSRKELLVLRGHADAVTSTCLSTDGKTVLTASDDNTARLWDATMGRELRALVGHTGAVTSAGLSVDGGTVLTASWDRTARLWDAASGEVLRVLRGHEDVVTSADFSADGRTVLTASADTTARLWDAASGKALRVLRGHTDAITSARLSVDGKTVLTASWDRTARLWDADSGKVLRVLRGHEDVVTSADLSVNGKTVLTTSEDETARLWDAATGKALTVLLGHEGAVTSAELSSEGRIVLTASADETARLWDAATGMELQVLRGHGGAVTRARFSADERTVVTASTDETARLWDAATGMELQVLRGHEGAVTSVRFSADGRTVVTASDDGTVRLWLCVVCGSVDEIARDLAKAVSRDLGDDERRQFAVPAEVSLK